MYTACTAEPRPAARRSHAAHSVRYDPCKKRPRGQSVRSTPHRRLIRNQLRQNGARHVCRGIVFHRALLSTARLYIIIYSLHCETPSCGLTRAQPSCAARHSNGHGRQCEDPASAPKIGGTPTNTYEKSANSAPARGSPFEAKSLSIGKACRSRPPFGKQLLEPPPAAGRRRDMHVAPLRLPLPKELLADLWKIRYNKQHNVWRFCVNPIAEPSCVFLRAKPPAARKYIGSCCRNA